MASGTDVILTARNLKPVRGTFVQADEYALIVRTGRWQVVETVARGDVQEIRDGRRSGKRRALGLLVGFGGFIGGAFVGGTLGGLGSEDDEIAGYLLGARAG